MDMVMEMIADERSKYHVTLGDMIEISAKATGVVRYTDGKSPGEEMSYRGYYSDLSFEDSDDEKSASDFHKQLTKAHGMEYTGYKGGENLMGDDTPLWRAEYSRTGEAIIDAQIVNGDLVLVSKNVDD